VPPHCHTRELRGPEKWARVSETGQSNVQPGSVQTQIAFFGRTLHAEPAVVGGRRSCIVAPTAARHPMHRTTFAWIGIGETATELSSLDISPTSGPLGALRLRTRSALSVYRLPSRCPLARYGTVRDSPRRRGVTNSKRISFLF
jgi:hypothetical protein